ncbi:MAG: transglutaminase-like putative cysteine protease [Desulforhopalus sp.]|jgi:transglutaminase-like putative cysteine protease
MSADNNAVYLTPTYFLDSTSPVVEEFAKRICKGAKSKKERAIRLYYAVRDEIRYDPYDLSPSRESFKASTVLLKGSGYCVAKAIALAALGRQQGIPSRLGFADVRNHLSTSRLREVMKSDTFYYHGYTEFLLEGNWVKATPAFNLSLCQRFRVKPLEFDGINDSIFHEFNEVDQKHMEYLHDHGSFTDLPFEEIFTAYHHHYPEMFARIGSGTVSNDFHKEAEQETP